MHYEWFKGFLYIDCRSKAWGLLEEDFGDIKRYNPCYTTSLPDAYFDEDLEVERPIEMSERYVGTRS